MLLAGEELFRRSCLVSGSRSAPVCRVPRAVSGVAHVAAVTVQLLLALAAARIERIAD